MTIKNTAVVQGVSDGGCAEDAFSGQSMPLSMVSAGNKVRVKSIGGKDETRRLLNSLGFIEDTELSVVSELNGYVIVNIKGSRLAISRAMANRVMTIVAY